MLRDYVAALWDDAMEWAEGRSPWGRLPLYLYLGYAGIRHAVDPMYRSWFAGLTLVLHELGHLFFRFFGRTLMLLGGSVFQLLIPALVALYFVFRQRDWFGAVVGASWLAFATWELATYVGDANKGQLALVGMSDDPIHDWDALLTGWHVLNHADTFAAALRVLAAGTCLAALAFGGVLLFRMLRAGR